jgi:hypothetical protein
MSALTLPRDLFRRQHSDPLWRSVMLAREHLFPIIEATFRQELQAAIIGPGTEPFWPELLGLNDPAKPVIVAFEDPDGLGPLAFDHGSLIDADGDRWSIIVVTRDEIVAPAYAAVAERAVRERRGGMLVRTRPALEQQWLAYGLRCRERSSAFSEVAR